MEIARIIVTVIHVIATLGMIAFILLQSGKQAGLSGSIAGAGETFFGKNKGRTMDAMFSRMTTVCAIVFLCTSLFLAYSFAMEAPQTTLPDTGSVTTQDPAATTDAQDPADTTADAPADATADTPAE